MRSIILGLALAGGVWLVGLAAFVTTLPEPTRGPFDDNDAVIVYTGGGGKRISSAMALFAGGAGERMLISGVHPETTRANMASLWEGDSDLFECCVDLGREARSTIGNASEAAKWAAAHNANRIVLVTSDYHMPRAYAETRAKMPGAAITPYVVPSGYLDENGRPLSLDAWEQLAGEYTKFLLAKANGFFASFSR